MHEKIALALLTFGGGTSAAELTLDEPQVRIHTSYIDGDDTDLPAELTIPRADLGTGSVAVEEPEATLVADAARYVHALAVLPTSDDDEELIDTFIRERIGERSGERM